VEPKLMYCEVGEQISVIPICIQRVPDMFSIECVPRGGTKVHVLRCRRTDIRDASACVCVCLCVCVCVCDVGEQISVIPLCV
jgi:hypothetical protein